jgi:soluble lytic murein transglycosylase-like protein
VQVTLVVAACAQFAAVKSGAVAVEERPAEVVGALNLTPLELEPVLVSEPDVIPEGIASAWQEKALERESERLLSEYRSRGYRVTPTLAQQISAAAIEHGIEPSLAFGLVRAESSFRTQATSRVGAVGLTQLMPRTAAWMEPGVTRSELRDPETNLRIGFKYLRYLLDKYEGDEKLALLAYNRGPGTVDRALRRGRSPDNGYADFVYGNANHGHRLFTR